MDWKSHILPPWENVPWFIPTNVIIIEEEKRKVKRGCKNRFVVKYNAPAPVAEDNIDAHMLFGMNGSNVRLTICGGKTVAKDGEAVGLDEEKVLYEAEKEAEKLWERF
ncbi:hypothetical protein LKD70_05905 [Ruminococcus sp. CLA-AA-H200]|uniref:Uncharacterized protein n=1 Tax=Ruminococcus turbiniformis TaxID=2881258 RepID=A0ABS8FVG6_9FIRM|nr:hypothetical protein [Ruminococcus turbiniformis]MCC2253973.1 hypothetical protein [Ruminococcus turbiniformis]